MGQIKKTNVKYFYVLSLKERVFFSLLFFIAIIFLTRYFFWWASPNHLPNNFQNNLAVIDFFLFALLTFVVFVGYSSHISIWLSIFFLSKPYSMKPKSGLKVAFLTCYVPGKEPIRMLEETLIAIKKVEYKHDTWVLDEGNDPNVQRLAEKLKVNYFTRANKRRYNLRKGIFRKKTKAGNHNAWRAEHESEYDIVAQVDMDHKPKPDFLLKTLGYFNDPKVAIVGSPEVYKNRSNWISKGGFEQSFIFHRIMQQGYSRANMPLLIGTSHLYRTSAMNHIGGYAPTIVEDHLTGMKFYEKGYKGVFVPHILAEGLGPLNWSDYFNQQMRWSYGLFEILFKYTPKIIIKLTLIQKINYFLAQLYYFSGVAAFLGILLTCLYLVFGINSTSIKFSEWVIYAFPAFIFSQIILIYSRKFSIKKGEAPFLGLRGKLLVLGANFIYAVSFFKFITGSNLKYVVTPKGRRLKPIPVPIGVFKIHVFFLIICIFSLIAGFLQGHNSSFLRFWAVMNIVILSTVIASNYSYFIFKFANNFSNQINKIPKFIIIYKKQSKIFNNTLRKI